MRHLKKRSFKRRAVRRPKGRGKRTGRISLVKKVNKLIKSVRRKAPEIKENNYISNLMFYHSDIGEESVFALKNAEDLSLAFSTII